jgi:hypothetical protein
MDIGKYEVLIMRLEGKPWQMDSNSGVAYTLHFMENGRVFKAKITESVFKANKDKIQENGKVTLLLDSYNGVPRLLCSDIE